MAKLSGPLLSVKASGSVGERLTFSERKSGSQARFQKAQKDVITAKRTTQRGYFRTSCDWWNTLTADEQAEWEDLSYEN